MKKLSFIFLALFSISSISQIPDYFGNNPSWHVSTWDIDEFGLNEYEACVKLYGDSTIGGHTYKVFKYEDNCNPIPTPIAIRLYRQEGRNIYRYWYDTDSLFISYELNIGDTIDSWHPDANIDAIDSILVGSEYRRTFRIDTLNSEKMLIEGIGTRYGHLNCRGYWFDYGYNNDGDQLWFGAELYTYSENGIILYGMDGCSALGLNENKTQKVSLYPVPSNNTVTITSESESLRLIEILDINGRTIMTQNVNNTESILDISFLENGVYFVRIAFQNDVIEVKRLVKN